MIVLVKNNNTELNTDLKWWIWLGTENQFLFRMFLFFEKMLKIQNILDPKKHSCVIYSVVTFDYRTNGSYQMVLFSKSNLQLTTICLIVLYDLL